MRGYEAGGTLFPNEGKYFFYILFNPYEPYNRLTTTRDLLSTILPLSSRPPFLISNGNLYNMNLNLNARHRPITKRGTPNTVLVRAIGHQTRNRRLPNGNPNRYNPTRQNEPTKMRTPNFTNRLLQPINDNKNGIRPSTRRRPFRLSTLRINPHFNRSTTSLSTLVMRIISPLSNGLRPTRLFRNATSHCHNTSNDNLNVNNKRFQTRRRQTMGTLTYQTFGSPTRPTTSNTLINNRRRHTVKYAVRHRRLYHTIKTFRHIVWVSKYEMIPSNFNTRQITTYRPMTPTKYDFRHMPLNHRNHDNLIRNDTTRTRNLNRLLTKGMTTPNDKGYLRGYLANASDRNQVPPFILCCFCYVVGVGIFTKF